jgi:hypothetical protein
MFIGIGTPIPTIANLPGSSRPGGGGSAFEYTAIDNSYSMEFDQAAGSYITTDVSSVGIDFSFSCWIKHSGNFSGTYVDIAFHSLVTSNLLKGGFYLYHSTGSNLVLRCDLDATRGTTQLGTGWNHVAGVWNNTTKSLVYYLNGQEEIGTVALPGYSLISRDLYLGGVISGYNSAGYNQFDGFIDEYAIWPSVLSEETIEAIYNATANNPGMVADLSETPEGAPTAWYRMGD